MIVCSCNVLTHHQVKGAANEMLEEGKTATISQVYQRLGCVERCGRCVPLVKEYRDQAAAEMTHAKAITAALSCPARLPR